MEIKDNVFVVTGGATGIGREIVLALVKNGASVAAVDINLEGLKQTKSLAGELEDKVSVHKLDISNLEEVVDFPKEVLDVHGRVDGLINNAGIIQPFKKVTDLDYSFIHKVINVNFFGAVYLSKAFLPIFLKNKTKASIINISSMAGFVPFPRQGIYGASKAALKIFSESLYSELKGTNVHVGVVFPGGVATDIAKNAGRELADTSVKTKSYKMLSPQEAASIILNAIKKDKFKTVAGNDAKTMDILYRLNSKKAADILVKNTRNMFKD